MSNNYGPGVSGVLDPTGTQYTDVIFQAGKPPCDREMTFVNDLSNEANRKSNLGSMPSGFLGNGTNQQASFLTDSRWSNWYKFGTQRTGEQAAVVYANVNGWLIPITETKTGTPPGSPNNTDTYNVITLDPPPTSDTRIDFVFLEVWQALISPNPSTVNKPAASAIYKYGNVESGASFLTDDLILPELGFETTKRVQIQYRIRVVRGLGGLTSYPDGFDPTTVKAQGAASAVTAFTFTNMRQTLGDPGLWRAGDGTENSLGTVDGYTYAIPISAVFRRNSTVWNGNPSQNLNGGFNRNPTAVDRTGVKTFSTTPTLSANLSAVATSATLVSASNIPLPSSPSTPVTIQIGDEIMTYATITGTTLNTLVRGTNGTVAEAHKSGAVVRVLSGRPDGLFADQIAATDILDLRHVVNPNGMDYTSLLKSNLDKLLRGNLRANWKRSGSGPQGTFVHYQDAIQSAAVSLGVTQLDAPDNIRMVFSDAATIQPIECVVAPHTAIVNPGTQNINVSWSLPIQVQTTHQTVANQFTAGDVIVIPVNQLKTGLQAGSTDQVRWLNDSVTDAIQLRFDGETGNLPSSMYTVTPAVPTYNDDLTITLSGTFPSQLSTTARPRVLHIKAHAVYGAGRGLSRRPDSLHSINYLNPSTDLLVQQWGVPTSNKGSRVSWAPMWSKYRSTTFNNLLPSTAELYADLGSKSVIVSPFRKIDFNPLLTVDGDAANPVPTAKITSSTGVTPAPNSATLNDASTAGAVIGDALIIPSGAGAGRYTIIGVAPTAYTLDRPILAVAMGSISYTVHSAQGCMPLLAVDGTTPKWTTTDPLGLFCGETAGNAAIQNIYVSLPRHLVPSWGEIKVPILTSDTATFAQGLNFLMRDTSGATTAAQSNYLAYFNGGGGSNEYAIFSQVDNSSTTLPFNTSGTGTEGNDWAGIRFFTDTRGLSRQGLEFPPFYGLGRVFGVYEASDYITNGSPFNDDRSTGGVGTAVNLLRQSMQASDGPAYWVEVDDDLDSTFILNANAIDITKSPVSIANFAAGEYVVEAAVFGFDRGSFSLGSEFRLVMTRPASVSPNNPNGWLSVGTGSVSDATRASNINKVVTAPTCVLPGPAQQSDQILINYSRTPYQGDAWGSQTIFTDIAYNLGPITSSNAYQVVSTTLDQDALTRPNQKVLEVLAATSFSTTLGTGRYAAEASTSALDFKDVGYEDPTAFPPTSGVDPRPPVLPANFDVADAVNIGTEYLGCSERLPLGALYRDKDFRGQTFSYMPSPIVFSETVGGGSSTSFAVSSQLEQSEVLLDTASSGVCSPGDVLVHVDGEQSPNNYSLLTNFRVFRGGSVFTGNGSYPGGSVSMQNLVSVAESDHVNVLHGRAMLVRNTVTNVGLTEVSAGSELMLLVLTSIQKPTVSTVEPSTISIGTNGDGEGYAAADLYRIEGHPLVRDNVRMYIDPSTIDLARKA